MIYFNAELWNIYQLCVLQVLNAKESIQTRKVENLAKVQISRHNFSMSQYNFKETSRYYDAPKPGGPLTTR